MLQGLLQPTHLILILVIALIVIGPGKIPDVGKALGNAIQGFRQATNEGQEKELKARVIEQERENSENQAL